MSQTPTTRRRFLQLSAATSAACWLGTRATGSAQGEEPVAAAHPVRLGAPIFNAPADPEGQARAHRQLGLRAAYCPVADLSNPQLVKDTESAFAKQDVVIAEVGRWKNLLAADPRERQENLQYVIDGLALADEIGARCCVDIAGSYSSESWFGPHPKNLSREHFDATVENARKILDAVKPKRAKFSFEMMGWALPDSPASYLELIKAVDRPGFAVHLDPCNLINCPARFYDTTALLNACFDTLGPWLVSAHAKDVAWLPEMQMHFIEVPIGKGTLDLRTYLRRLAALPNDVPLMIEHMQNEAEYTESREQLFAAGKELGLSF